MIQLPSEFRAHLETFRGPLDLLLYLIRKEEVDILDVPISRITDQYLAYLNVLKLVDPNSCGEFLVMAAKLMEIKSKTLLPVAPVEEDEEELEDPRLELVLQLLEYKKYKERALLLEKQAQDHGRRYRRPESDLADFEVEEDHMPLGLGNVSVWDLLTAFQKVRMAVELRQPHRVLLEDRPVEEYMKALGARLEDEPDGSIRFEQLFEECRDLYDAIGFFLALLEMAKQGKLRFDQEEAFGDILIQRRDPSETIPEIAPVADTDSVPGTATDSAPATDSDTDSPTVRGP